MAKELISINDVSMNEWLEIQRNGICDTDAATVVGLEAKERKTFLWSVKMGILQNNVNEEKIRLERDMEDYIILRFAEESKKKIVKNQYLYQSDQHHFMTAFPAGHVIGENAGLKSKCEFAYVIPELEAGKIPKTYYCECVQDMAVMGYERMYLAILVYEKGFYFFTIERNEKEITNLIQAEKKFWNEYMNQEEQTESALNPMGLFGIRTLKCPEMLC